MAKVRKKATHPPRTKDWKNKPQQTRQMLQSKLKSAPNKSLCHCVFNANHKMRKRNWTAQLRADRGRQSRKPLKSNHNTTCKQMPTHTCDLNGKVPEGLSNRSRIYRRGGHLFEDFDAGAQGEPKEAAKLPKGSQGTPNGRPRVHKCL